MTVSEMSAENLSAVIRKGANNERTGDFYFAGGPHADWHADLYLTRPDGTDLPLYDDRCAA